MFQRIKSSYRISAIGRKGDKEGDIPLRWIMMMIGEQSQKINFVMSLERIQEK